MSMQAIESKKAAGDTASVQQEVDGIAQQLRLHVSSVSYTNATHLCSPSQALTSACLSACILLLVTSAPWDVSTAPWDVTTAQTIAVHQLGTCHLCCQFDTASSSFWVLQQAWQQLLQQLGTVCVLRAVLVIDKR